MGPSEEEESNMEACTQAAAFVLGVCEAETYFMEGTQHVQGPAAGRSNPAVL